MTQEMRYAQYGIGGRIRDLRESHGFSQKSLGVAVQQACGVRMTKQAVQSWESGRTIPQYEAQLALGSIFGVSPCHIMFQPRNTPEEP